jgi:hypothetical protein
VHLLFLLGAEELVETVGLKQLTEREFRLFFFFIFIQIAKFVGVLVVGVLARPTEVTLCLFLLSAVRIGITGLCFLLQRFALTLLRSGQSTRLLVVHGFLLLVFLVLIAHCVFLRRHC